MNDRRGSSYSYCKMKPIVIHSRTGIQWEMGLVIVVSPPPNARTIYYLFSLCRRIPYDGLRVGCGWYEGHITMTTFYPVWHSGL